MSDFHTTSVMDIPLLDAPPTAAPPTKRNRPVYRTIQYFNGLDSLRFIAAAMVVVFHAEGIRAKQGLAHLSDLTLFQNGFWAVRFFFVLSGFLITFLLLKEYEKTQTINILQFYYRRVLRIWPLYFLLVAIGLWIVPTALAWAAYPYVLPYKPLEALPYYLFFQPYLVNIWFGHHLLEPLWSIGVEEMFYLFWAPLMAFLLARRSRSLPLVFVSIIGLKWLIKLYFEVQAMQHTFWAQVADKLQFEAMAMGALFAYFCYHTTRPLSKNKWFGTTAQVVFFGVLIARLGFHQALSQLPFVNVPYTAIFDNTHLTPYLLDALFGWLIINTALNDKSWLRLRGNIGKLGGSISYGVYMYHLLVIFVIIAVTKPFLLQLTPPVQTVAFYAMIGSGILLVSYLSKKYFEDWFLQYK